MILQSVHLPQAYRIETTANETEQRFNCSAVVGALRDAVANGVLLVDRQGTIETAATDELTRWPIKHRQRAQELIVKLKKRNRIVQIDAPIDERCLLTSCQHAIGIASSQVTDAVVIPAACVCRRECFANPKTAIPIDEYIASSFATKSRSSQSIVFSDGQVVAAEMAQRVFQPIMLHARYVRLFDRVLGTHLTNQLVGQRYAGSSNPPHPSYAFERSLTWLFQLYATQGVSPIRTMEICTAVEGQSLSEGEIAEAAAALRGLAARMGRTVAPARDAIQLSMTVKVESASQRMRHARFLFTDQVQILVERGFDLLRADGRVRDAVLSIEVPDPGAIEAEYRALPDAP